MGRVLNGGRLLRRGANATVVLICFGAFLALLILIGIAAGRGMAQAEHTLELRRRLAESQRELRARDNTGDSVVGLAMTKEAEVIREFASKYSSSTFGKICYGFAVAYNQLVPVGHEYDRSHTAFKKAGGFLTSTLKDRDDAGRRLAALPAMIKANRDMVAALKAFPETVEQEIERAGVSRAKARKEIVTQRLSERFELYASVCNLETDLLGELQTQLRILREHDGQWTSSNGRAFFSSDVPAKAQQQYRESLERMAGFAQRLLGLVAQIQSEDELLDR